MKKKISMIVLALIATAGIMIASKEVTKEYSVVINEIRSTTASKDRTQYFGSDYIELYNGADEDISLEGWYLSDDEADLLKCQLSEVVIPARGYVALHADDGRGEDNSSLDFKISPMGEKLFLSDSSGELVDSVLIPELKFGETYSRTRDGKDSWVIKEESYLESNELAEEIPDNVLEIPVFSHESGFYAEEFKLEMHCKWGETIYYTLDGSIPTKDSLKYENPIIIKNNSEQPNTIKAVRNVIKDWEEYYPENENLDKAVVVRALSVDRKGRVSDVVTKTYFVDLEKYKNENIISVVAEYDDLFGDYGIFVTGKEYDEAYLAGVNEDELPDPNFIQSGRQWEILGNLQLFSEEKEIFNQPAGIRTYGGSNRHGKTKRMSFYSRMSYSGNDCFENLLLADREIHSMGTNSSVGNVILPQLVTDRSVATQGAMKTKIFLNGEYYSEHSIMEKFSNQFFVQKYGVEGDNLILIKDGEVSEGTSEDGLTYKWLLKVAGTEDLSIAENYAEVEKLMDVQSYIDFICTNVYLCNMDMSETKNYLLWRTRVDEGTAYGDTRFRWMVYDMGALDGHISLEHYGIERAAELNSFTVKGRHVGHSINEQTIYQGLKVNPTFCKQFVLSFMDMTNVNFAVENVEKVFEQYEFEMKNFGDFFERRFEYIVPYMAEEFGLTGTLEEIVLEVSDPEGGTIQLNTTIPDLSEGSWRGLYYTDYPVTVTAVPNDGYIFEGWSGDVASAENTVEADVLAGGTCLKAIFSKIK